MSTPEHYDLNGGADALDVMQGCMTPEQYVGFLKGNVVKYAIRLGRKGGPADWIVDAGKLADYASRYAAAISKQNRRD